MAEKFVEDMLRNNHNLEKSDGGGGTMKKIAEAFKMNPTTLSGATDIVIIKHPDGSMQCSPFNLRFGKSKAWSTQGKEVQVWVGGSDTGVRLTLTNKGVAIFNHLSAPSQDDLPLLRSRSNPETQSYQPSPLDFSFYVVPSNAELYSMKLNDGENKVSFKLSDGDLTDVVHCSAFVWDSDARIVVSDVDGTVTKSDLGGHLLPAVGIDHAQDGVARLYSEIQNQGYQILYLSSRPVGMSQRTRNYLQGLSQQHDENMDDGTPVGVRYSLPRGPLFLSPDSTWGSLKREIIHRKPQEFKIFALKIVLDLFPEGTNPFVAGFGNRPTDVVSYKAVNIPGDAIFTVNKKGDYVVDSSKIIYRGPKLQAYVYNFLASLRKNTPPTIPDFSKPMRPRLKGEKSSSLTNMATTSTFDSDSDATSSNSTRGVTATPLDVKPEAQNKKETSLSTSPSERVCSSVIDTIGQTPLVELSRIVKHFGLDGKIYAKLEMMNPGLSKKDRIAREIILKAEADGTLKPRQPVVELTSGNTGTGLAIVCAVTGHKFYAVMSKGNSVERAKMMRGLGAHVVLVDQAPNGIPGQVTGEDIALLHAETERIVADFGAFRADQFNNRANFEAHYKHTAPEVMRATDGQFDGFCDFVGSGGTFGGCAKKFKEENPDTKCYILEPEGCPLLSGNTVKSDQHVIQGGGYSIPIDKLPLIEPLGDKSIVDGYLQITDTEATETARLLATCEGIFGGYSGGANVAGAIQLLKGPLQGKTVVCLICDTGMKYLSGDLWDVKEKSLFDPTEGINIEYVGDIVDRESAL